MTVTIDLMLNTKWSGQFFSKNGAQKCITVKPRFTMPRFTGSLDLLGINSIPLKQASCVNHCKMYPDIPCFSIYRA